MKRVTSYEAASRVILRRMLEDKATAELRRRAKSINAMLLYQPKIMVRYPKRKHGDRFYLAMLRIVAEHAYDKALESKRSQP